SEAKAGTPNVSLPEGAADSVVGSNESSTTAAGATLKLASLEAPESLAQLLASHRAETVPDEAFSKLFAIWNLRYTAGNEDPCAQAAAHGLECLVERG